MSLINDALKQAKQLQKTDPPPAGGTPLLHVESNTPNIVAWMLPVIIIILVVVACFVLGLGLAQHTVTTIIETPEPNVTQQEIELPEDAQLIPMSTATSAPVPGSSETNAAATATNTAGPVDPELPTLQGIAYDPKKPWAILSGQTVYIGGTIGAYRVKAISKFTVTVVGPSGKPVVISLAK